MKKILVILSILSPLMAADIGDYMQQESKHIELFNRVYQQDDIIEVPNNVESIDLRYSTLNCRLTPLAHLPNLKKLNLFMCEEVPNLDDLAQSKSLEELNLLGVYVDDVSFLSAIPTLKKIEIGDETNYYTLLAIKSLEDIIMNDLGDDDFKEQARKELPNLKGFTFR